MTWWEIVQIAQLVIGVAAVAVGGREAVTSAREYDAVRFDGGTSESVMRERRDLAVLLTAFAVLMVIANLSHLSVDQYRFGFLAFNATLTRLLVLALLVRREFARRHLDTLLRRMRDDR